MSSKNKKLRNIKLHKYRMKKNNIKNQLTLISVNSFISRYSMLLLVFLLIFVSCSTQKLPVREISIEREGQVLAVVKAEIASTNEERAQGLMYRKSLKDGEGMLFIFESDQILAFWMKNTLIPLSIAYITYDGRIIDIKDMYPHDETPVTSSRSSRFALEVPQGWYSRAGIKVGDNVKNLY